MDTLDILPQALFTSKPGKDAFGVGRTDNIKGHFEQLYE